MTKLMNPDSSGTDYLAHPHDLFAVTPEFVQRRGRLSSSILSPDILRNRQLINLASLDYLAMAAHPAVIAAKNSAYLNAVTAADQTSLNLQLQRELAELTGKQSCLLFKTGYAAMVGVCMALLRPGDIAILDEHVAMAFRHAVKMAGAKPVIFSHNDPFSLDQALTRNQHKRRCVIVNGLYDRDGDFAALNVLLDVADAHGVGVIVDEADSLFADGSHGGGLTERLDEQGRVRVLIGRFSRALGLTGGFIATHAELADFMLYYAHPAATSGYLSLATVCEILAAIRVVRDDVLRRERLQDNATYLREGLLSLGVNIADSQSWLVPILFGNRPDLLFESISELMALGVYAASIDAPSVPEDNVRIRLAISAGHTQQDLDTALNHLETCVVGKLQKAGLLTP